MGRIWLNPAAELETELSLTASVEVIFMNAPVACWPGTVTRTHALVTLI
jgi:hypothetical protein